jgi:hypothetical protein
MGIAVHGQAKVFAQGTSGTLPTFTMINANTIVSGYGAVRPALTTASLRQVFANGDDAMGASGRITGIHDFGEHLVCTFTLRPEGSTAAAAALSARLPELGSTFLISGMPVVIMGGFTDAFNTGTTVESTTPRWHYRGGGELSVSTGADGFGMITIELRRYPHIPGGAPIIQ